MTMEQNIDLKQLTRKIIIKRIAFVVIATGIFITLLIIHFSNVKVENAKFENPDDIGLPIFSIICFLFGFVCVIAPVKLYNGVLKDEDLALKSMYHANTAVRKRKSFRTFMKIIFAAIIISYVLLLIPIIINIFR